MPTSAPLGGEVPDGELPDDAVLCSCNNVNAGTIRDAVGGCGSCEGQEPVTNLSALKGCTRAGTQCGSCVPMLKKLMETEMLKNGAVISAAMCEHFELSRAQLFEAVRVAGLKTYPEIMQRFGQGAGCDICKPVIASVLASQTSGHPMEAGLAGAQDTNDRVMANMQKDGTYSVVPRIPGGEITPQKLGVIAAVAAKYNLYTKLTGGLRIDMFGARLEQLPDIWKELVDAGFESGQAYGKSLRNVKTCVGSSWCRYGMLDSVAMGIEMELRYRGLRAPHKFKMGVSGCARECAEARAKDVGVIATAEGWNLYVGGNGGANPAHAQLLAGGIDDQTLIRYVDRYLMCYIRTADKLQRTARWMEDLDGGIDMVRSVVVEDSLGLAPNSRKPWKATSATTRTNGPPRWRTRRNCAVSVPSSTHRACPIRTWNTSPSAASTARPHRFHWEPASASAPRVQPGSHDVRQQPSTQRPPRAHCGRAPAARRAVARYRAAGAHVLEAHEPRRRRKELLNAAHRIRWSLPSTTATPGGRSSKGWPRARSSCCRTSLRPGARGP